MSSENGVRNTVACLSCRYDPQLKQKVLEMAEGISVGEMRSYELVPSAEAKKRPRSSEGSKCLSMFACV